MNSSLRRALGVAAVAVATRTGALDAQAPAAAPPPVSVSGVVFTQVLYQLTDTLNHVNRFDITRAYINLIGKFSGGLYTRVTADIYNIAPDSSRAYRIKYAYVAYTPAKSPLTFKIGEMHTPWVEWEDAMWDYRVQGTSAMDRNGYLSSSDFGAGVDGKWGPDKVNFQVGLYNGENYNKGTGDQRKDGMARVSVRVRDTDDSSRVGGLRVSAYGQYGKPTTGGERQRWLGMVSYRSKQLTLAAEAAIARDSTTGTAGPPVVAALARKNGHVYSAFGVYKFTKSKAAVIARVDIFHPQSGNTTDKQTRIIAGVSYQIHPNWRLLLDWDYVNYQTDALNTTNGPTRSQALFQTQFTF